MKIVVISDIHANLDALTALPESGDELWVLGDLVDYGPNPREVVSLLRSRAHLVVRGNHDQAVGFEDDPRCTPRYRKMAMETRDYTIRTLNRDLARYLQQLPLHKVLERDGKKFYFCHSIPLRPALRLLPGGFRSLGSGNRRTRSRLPARRTHPYPFHPAGGLDDSGESRKPWPA